MAFVCTPVINRAYRVTTGDNGNFLVLGNAADGMVGTWLVHFVPDPTFTGSLAVTARAMGKPPADDSVAFVSVPYRRAYLNGAVSDYGIDTALVTGTSIVQVPANGLSVALLAGVTAGYGWLYTWPLEGPSAP